MKLRPAVMQALMAPLLVALALLLAMLLVPSYARASEAAAQATLTGITFEIYDAIPSDGIAPSVTFFNDTNHWRTLVQPNGHTNSDYFLSSAVVYRATFDASDEAEQVLVAGGSASGAAHGLNLQAASDATGWGYYFSGYAGVSSTGGGNIEDGFYNMILGIGTGVRLTGHGMADVSLVDRCLVTCGEAWAQASLFARFGAIDPAQPGNPQHPVSRYDTLYVALGAADITGSGGLLALQGQRDLSLSYENLSGADQIGRVRWDAWTETTAPVDEPASGVLMGLGFAALALRRLRKH